MDARAELGARAEGLVAQELEKRGFRVLARNTRVGRLEIDLIARRRDLIVFCEVRALTSDHLMSPAHTIGPQKIERVRRAAALWLTSAKLGGVDVRFDAAAVVFGRETPRIDYYEAAF
ncbi:MAG TPA: YraN family protein [Polyangiales bacterium]|nr:YraN family protein [Polyangiales bacterium]